MADVAMPLALNKDFVLGGLLMALGAGAAFIAGGYPQGTLRFMGPGFVPNWLGRIIVLLGLLIVLRGIIAARHSGWGEVPWRALVLVPGATVLFGLMVPRLGLLFSCAIAALATCYAMRGVVLKQALVTSAVIAAVFTLLFAILLKVPLPVWPS